MKKILITFSLIFGILTSTQAQTDDPLLGSSMRDVMTVVATGATGAILGLSTLSFAEEPKEHLKNIVVGAAIGVIVGVGVVAWGQASKSQSQFNEEEAYLLKKDFPSVARRSWHHEAHHNQRGDANLLTTQIANYTFKF